MGTDPKLIFPFAQNLSFLLGYTLMRSYSCLTKNFPIPHLAHRRYRPKRLPLPSPIPLMPNGTSASTRRLMVPSADTILSPWPRKDGSITTVWSRKLADRETGSRQKKIVLWRSSSFLSRSQHLPASRRSQPPKEHRS